MVHSLSLRTVFTTIAMVAALIVPMVMLAGSANAQVEVSEQLCDGIGFTLGNESGDGCGDGTEGDDAVSSIIKTIVDIFSIIVGAVSVIMIIVGGLRYITSSGDSANVQAAKNTILYAVVGLVIVIFAQTIVKFVVDRSTSTG